MSSGSDREPLSGLIRQGNQVVGSICIPDASEIFIREFNHCYGQLRMQIEQKEPPLPQAPGNPHTFRLPSWFRHVWHPRIESE